MSITHWAIAAIYTTYMALALPTSVSITSSPSHTTNRFTPKTLNLPISPSTSQDISVDTTFGSLSHRMKGGQLLYTMYAVIEKLWDRTDNPSIVSPTVYHGSAFYNIEVIATPSPFRRGRPLTTSNVVYALYVIARALQSRSHWPSSIAARIRDGDTAQIVGLIDITETGLSNPSLNPPTNETGKYLDLRQDNSSLTTTIIGDDISHQNLTCPRGTTSCSLHHIAASRPIPDRIWLELFHSLLSNCFALDATTELRNWVTSSKVWTTMDEWSGVEMKLQFYDLALSPYHGMLFRDLVAGLLEILREWAWKDDWKTGWGLIERWGQAEALLTIRYIARGERAGDI